MVSEWIAEHWASMVIVANGFAGRATTADDIAQDAAVIALAQPEDKVRAVIEPKGWLLGITKNVGRQLVRKRVRREVLLGKHQLEVGDMVDGASRVDEEAAKVAVALDALPARQQEVIRCMLRGLTDDEILEELGIQRGALWVYRHRAVARLRMIVGLPCS